MTKSIIRGKSFQFALDIIKLYQQLTQQKEFIISKQLLRCWTSIGANIEEAQSWQSKKDFLAKVYISLKESKETRYWLKLLQESDLINNVDLTKQLQDIEEIIKILTKITKTTTNNINKKT